MAYRSQLTNEVEPVLSEINVTPFIDVMLVLLVIFMIVAPLSTVSVPIDLPVSTSKPSEAPQDPLIISLKDDLSLSLGDKAVAREGLSAALADYTHGDKNSRLFIRADKQVAYQDLMTLMDDLRAAGYLKVALVGLGSSTN